MTNNILDFIVLDDDQAPVLNEQGLPQLLPRPDTKTTQDIERLIALIKPVEVINKFAELASLGEQWDWAQSYYDYLVELNRVTEFNANLPEPVANEDGTLTEFEPLPEPTAPERPTVKTVEDVLSPYSHHITKLKGIEHKGVCVTLNESNQNGLSALKSALELATEFGEVEQFFPIKFNAETSNGVQVLLLEDEAEFKQFGLDFIMARKALFE